MTPLKKVRFRNDHLPPPPPPPKKINKSTNLHTPKSITFLKFLTKNNATNLNINENIEVPSPQPRIVTAQEPPRLEECHFVLLVFNKQRVHLPSFLTLKKEFRTHLNVILQKTSKPLYNIIITYYTACLRHDSQC